MHIGGVEAVGRPEGVKLGEIFDETYVARVSSETAGLFPVRHSRSTFALRVARQRHCCTQRHRHPLRAMPYILYAHHRTLRAHVRLMLTRASSDYSAASCWRDTRKAASPTRAATTCVRCAPAHPAHVSTSSLLVLPHIARCLSQTRPRPQVVAANELDEVPGQRIGLFGVVKGADEVAAAKPAPDGLIECCEVRAGHIR